MMNANNNTESDYNNCNTRKISGELFECHTPTQLYCGFGLNFGDARYCKHERAASFVPINPKLPGKTKQPTTENTL